MPTKFCPVCKAAGKPESVYTSHYVKNKPGPDGVVICPHLLGQECGYCREKGHTPKFCPKLANRNAKTSAAKNCKTSAAKKHGNKFCPVCKAAGKPESVYTSHYVKDKPGPDGVVVCPHLLEQECGYCHEKGHTPKFCPKLAKRNAKTSAEEKKVGQFRSPGSMPYIDPFDDSEKWMSQRFGTVSTRIVPMSTNQSRQVKRAEMHAASTGGAAKTSPVSDNISAVTASQIEAICNIWGCSKHDLWDRFLCETKSWSFPPSFAFWMDSHHTAYTSPASSFMPKIVPEQPAGMPKITLEMAKLHAASPNSEEQVHLRLFPQTAYTDEELESADKALEEEIEFDNHLDQMPEHILNTNKFPSPTSRSWGSDDDE